MNCMRHLTFKIVSWYCPIDTNNPIGIEDPFKLFFQPTTSKVWINMKKKSLRTTSFVWLTSERIFVDFFVDRNVVVTMLINNASLNTYVQSWSRCLLCLFSVTLVKTILILQYLQSNLVITITVITKHYFPNFWPQMITLLHKCSRL